MDYQEAEGIHSNKNCDPFPLYRSKPDFRPRTQGLKEKPGPPEEGLYNTITCIHSNYSFRTFPKETMLNDAGNYTGERREFRLLRHLKMSDIGSKLILILEDLKHYQDAPLRIRIMKTN